MQQNIRDANQPGIQHLNNIRGLHLQTMLSRLQQEYEANPTLFGRVSFPAGQKFISQGEPDTTVYILLRGKAKVSKIDEQGVSHDLVVLSSPTIVGELSALSQGRTADVSAERVVEAITLSVAGTDNTFAGAIAGAVNTGGFNSFFGKSAGSQNTTGDANSFFGRNAGQKNTTGGANSFLGDSAGYISLTGSYNTYVGDFAGYSMSTGDYNTFIGKEADGTSGITRATAIGSFAKVTQSNSLVLGSISGPNGVPDTNVGIGTTAPAARLDVVGNINTSTQYNIGGNRVLSVTGGGILNNSNTFAGVRAGSSNTPNENIPTPFDGNANSFFGFQTGFNNQTGGSNSFFGYEAGYNNHDGENNTFLGANSGGDNTTGFANTFVGYNAGITNTTETYNTFVGQGASGGAGFFNAAAIGALAMVEQSNSLVLGSINGKNGASSNTKVGIGTTTPTATLTVVTPSLSSGENTATFKTTNNAQNQSHIHFGTTGNWFIRSAASAGKVILQDTGGNVGIGTSAPNAKLQVTGGNVYIANPNSLIITSSNGACWFVVVNNSGALSTNPITCP